MSDRLPKPLATILQPSTAERASATPRRVQAIRAATRVDAGAARPAALAELQGWLLDAICGPTEPTVTGILADGPQLSAAEGLGIYRYAYRARLRGCLRDDYPVLAASLGDARFDALCDAYLESHPSRSPSLNAFGRELPSLCAATSGAFYAELAALEWALVEITHAATPVPLDLAELQRIPAEAWGQVRLLPSEALRLLTFAYPVNAHYQAYRSEGVVLPPPAAAASATAVYRRDLALWRMDLTPAMTRVLSALIAGRTLAEALGEIGAGEPDVATQAEAERSVMIWFREWVLGGFFTRVA